MAAAEEYLERLRSRLLLDWDDPLFGGPRFVGDHRTARRPLTDLVGPRSAQALVWSTFRTLYRLPTNSWLAPLLHLPPEETPTTVDLEFWATVPPPRARLVWLLNRCEALTFHDPLRAAAAAARLERVARDRALWEQRLYAGALKGDGVFEDATEVDLVLRTPQTLMTVMALYQGDITTGTPWDPQRDGIARAIDAALTLAEDRGPGFLLLTDSYSRAGVNGRAAAFEALMPRYRDDAAFLRQRLPHRPDGELARLEGNIQWLSWADLTDLVLDHSAGLPMEHKRMLINLVQYLRDRRLLHKGG